MNDLYHALLLWLSAANVTLLLTGYLRAGIRSVHPAVAPGAVLPPLLMAADGHAFQVIALLAMFALTIANVTEAGRPGFFTRAGRDVEKSVDA